MNNSPVGAELYHLDRRTDGRTDERTDRRTDINKLIVAYHNFVKCDCFENAPNEWHIKMNPIANDTMELCLSRLAHFNPEEAHIILYINRKVGGGNN